MRKIWSSLDLKTKKQNWKPKPPPKYQKTDLLQNIKSSENTVLREAQDGHLIIVLVLKTSLILGQSQFNICVSLTAPHFSQTVDPGALFPLQGTDWLLSVPGSVFFDIWRFPSSCSLLYETRQPQSILAFLFLIFASLTVAIALFSVKCFVEVR